MRWTYLFLILLLQGCGGTLSEEQRKQLREGREQQIIKKVSDADILTQAFKTGRAVMQGIESSPMHADSIAESYLVEVKWLQPGLAGATDIESQLIEAYLSSLMMGEELKDNVQRIGEDSVLYTKPVVSELPDGVVEVKGTWNIRMAKKQLVLAMDKK